MFDEEPDEQHGECRAEIHKQAARIAELEAALGKAIRQIERYESPTEQLTYETRTVILEGLKNTLNHHKQ